MRSKLTKTIFIIVFVVFLGLIKTEIVKAESYFAQCYYSEGDLDVIVGIQYNFSFAEIVYRNDIAYNSYKSIQNWSPTSMSSRSTGYNGYDDSWNNNKCPDYLVFKEKNYAYFSDASKLETVKSWVNTNILSSNNLRTLSLVSHTYPDFDSSREVEYMKCSCSSGSNSLTYEIAKNGVLTLPSILGNSATRDNGYWYSYGLPYVSASNTCPERLFKKGTSYYFSSAADAETVKSKISGNVTEMTCQVAADTPTQNRIPKPEYNPPTVNTENVGTLNPGESVYSCGNGYITDIPSGILRVIRIFYIVLQVLVPIALVILGSMDLMKAITSQKDDEIKKGQQTFVKRLIAAAIIFFVFIIVKLIIGVFSNDDNEIISCMNCFLDGVDSCE